MKHRSLAHWSLPISKEVWDQHYSVHRSIWSNSRRHLTTSHPGVPDVCYRSKVVSQTLITTIDQMAEASMGDSIVQS